MCGEKLVTCSIPPLYKKDSLNVASTNFGLACAPYIGTDCCKLECFVDSPPKVHFHFHTGLAVFTLVTLSEEWGEAGRLKVG